MTEHTFSVGTKVRVKAGVNPCAGWGSVKDDEYGVVTEVGIPGLSDMTVDFPSQCGWKARSSEMERWEIGAPCRGQVVAGLTQPDANGNELENTKAELAEVKAELEEAKAEIKFLRGDHKHEHAEEEKTAKETAKQLANEDAAAEEKIVEEMTRKEAEETDVAKLNVVAEKSSSEASGKHAEEKESAEKKLVLDSANTGGDEKEPEGIEAVKQTAASDQTYSKGDIIVLHLPLRVNGIDCPVGKEGEVIEAGSTGIRVKLKGAGTLQLKPDDHRLKNFRPKPNKHAS